MGIHCEEKGHVKDGDDPTFGEVWTYCAIDPETKLIPSYLVASARNMPNTVTFINELALRLNNRIQLSSDAIVSYSEAISLVFGDQVDYGQIVKTFGPEESKYETPERKYSPSRIGSSEKIWMIGTPEAKNVSTSYVEHLNASTRLLVKRLNQLTLSQRNAKDLEAAVALNFAAHNFVRQHRSLKMSPAMGAGVERNFWSFGDLVEAVL